MYSRTFNFKDLNERPRAIKVHFNLFERDVFRVLPQLKTVFDKQEELSKGGIDQTIDPVEVAEYYTSFEELLLEAYGEPSDDGLRFPRSGRYDFEESLAFNAAMVYFLGNPSEMGNLLNKIMPDGFDDILKSSKEDLERASVAAKSSDERQSIDDLRRKLAELETAENRTAAVAGAE